MTIEIVGLSKIYQSRGKIIQAVDNLSLSVGSSTVLSFLGPNGAGKTTTIKMICGLITPTAGRICLNGFDLARQPRKALGQIGVVLEGARNLYWRLSAWDNLLYFGRLRGQSTKKIKERAEHLLRELGLWERRHDLTDTFSRGMQQKIAIASALITDPPIVLLDEPTLGLDVEAARMLEAWVTKLAHEEGKAVLLTTHQLDMAERVSDRVAIIQKGHLLANDPVSDLLDLSQHPTYTVTVEGSYTADSFPWLKDLAVTAEGPDMTTISGIADEQRLYDLLPRLQNAKLPLLSATRDQPALEEIFLQFLNKDRNKAPFESKPS